MKLDSTHVTKALLLFTRLLFLGKQYLPDLEKQFQCSKSTIDRLIASIDGSGVAEIERGIEKGRCWYKLGNIPKTPYNRMIGAEVEVLALCRDLLAYLLPIPSNLASPFDDAATYALYASGELAPEYFHGQPWLRLYARWLKPSTFDDLTALFLLWGTPDLRHKRLAEYIRRRHGKDASVAAIPELEPFLRDSRGLLIYREQAAQIFHHIGGYSMDAAIGVSGLVMTMGIDGLLKSTDFVDRATSRGYSAKTIGNIISLLSERYSILAINSWYASKAFISYQAVYLKAHGV